MTRLTLAARITLIVAVSLTAVWIAAIASFYRARFDATTGARPTPQRIAALVALIEASSPAQRRLAIAAATAEGFHPSLLEPGAAPSDGPAVGDDIRAPYVAALDGRALTLTAAPASALARWVPDRLAASAAPLSFRIALRSGETLAIDSSSPVIFTRFGVPVGFGAGLFGTLVAIAALLVMQRETRPLARLAAAVDRLALSSEPAMLPERRTGAPEIRAVVAAFNRLQQRLTVMLRARMALIGGISHDVRTFATRLRLRVDRIADADERRRAVADIDDMIRLLDDALLASRAGAGELGEEMVEFADVVRADTEDRRAHGAAVTLTVGAAAAAAVVLGDRLALRRIVANLTDNAIAYGRAARLSLDAGAKQVMLTVEDDGPGIPPELRAEMLEPFSRLEVSRSRGTGGAGLGLAVVRTLTEAHGGTVAIGETAQGGARIVVTLPRLGAGDAGKPS